MHDVIESLKKEIEKYDVATMRPEKLEELKDLVLTYGALVDVQKDCLEMCYMKDIKIPNKIREGELTEWMLDEYESNPEFGVMGNERYGYRGRAANGRFVHRSGRGRTAGYMPYFRMNPDEGEYESMRGEMPYPMNGYRMGYTGEKPSRYGESYDRMSEYRRHYTESKSPEDKKRMEEYMKRYAKDFMDSFSEVKADADPAAWQALKQDMVKFVQSM